MAMMSQILELSVCHRFKLFLITNLSKKLTIKLKSFIMKNKIRNLYRCLSIILYFVVCANFLNAQDIGRTHIRKGFTDFGFPGQVGEYEFNNTDENAGFLVNFPWQKMEQEISEDILNDWEIEYHVYTSVEDAELAVVEIFELSNLGMYNMIDSMLPNGPIGDNCFYNLRVGAIRFIRNNIFIRIVPKTQMSDEEYKKADWLARKIDTLLIESDRVTDAKLISAPEIQSIEITSDLPKNREESAEIKVNATDPKSQQLIYRQYSAGSSFSSTTGDLSVYFSKYLLTEDSTKARVKIWVWNEDNIVASVEYDIPF